MNSKEQITEKRIIILDGTRSEDEHLESVLTLLTDTLEKEYATQVKQFRLRSVEINHCIGCFNCWIKTPGRCIYNDAGNTILQDILKCDILILFTPVVFGGYSSELKKMIDRFLPLWLPFFQKNHGEIHHPFRYPTLSRLIGIGVHPQPSEKISQCFRLLVGRNAENLCPSSYTASVVNASDSKKRLSNQFHTLLSQEDKLPCPDNLISLMNSMSSEAKRISIRNRRALLLVGSPKIKKPSTSNTLGSFLLKQLEKRNWDTASLTLSKSILENQGKQNKLLSAIKKADIILLAFPLYIDTLPFLVTNTLEMIARRKKTIIHPDFPKYFLPLVNNGFPEVYQNAPALAVCRNFAIECGMNWVGGLAMGAGEGLVSGHTLTSCRGFSVIRRPPLYYIMRALNITATSLTAGKPIPQKAIRLMGKKPLPFLPFALWRQIVIGLGKIVWVKEAALNGVSRERIFDKPYENIWP